MKRILLFIISIFYISFAQEIPSSKKVVDIDNSFITKFEYGKMLYHNPRGIGCNKCHGEKAEGKKLVNFVHNYKNKEYKCSMVIPSITETDYETFKNKINQKRNPNKKFTKEQICEKLIYYANVMPTYFLVDEEIDGIYYYIQNLK